MNRYDPLEAPNPKEWFALDEQERLNLTEEYHRRVHISSPNEGAHALIHVIVENQIALGDQLPVRRALERLVSEGLDRHDAVHAIGSTLLGFINDVMRDPKSDASPSQEYCAAIERLTADDWLQAADEPAAELIQIIDDLVTAEGLPVDAIRAAGLRRAEMVPMFLDLIEGYLIERSKLKVQQALFFIFHLLGEWREKSAYRPLGRLLRLPSDEIEGILSDAITETSHRVMAAVFNGDPRPLYDVILDPEADEFARSRMCETLAMVTLRGDLPRAEAVRFLTAGYSDIEPQHGCFVWNGWQSAIAMLGLVDLKPLVEQAFRRGSIDPSVMSFEHFEEDLQRTLDGSKAPPWSSDSEYSLWGNTIEELSTWAAFRPDSDKNGERYADDRDTQWSPNVPAINPFKGVGRNDPCPCGSGKKFKKCCLN